MLLSVECIKLKLICHILNFENRQVQGAICHEPWLPLGEPSQPLGPWQDTWHASVRSALVLCVRDDCCFPRFKTGKLQLWSTFFSRPPDKLGNCGYFPVLDLKPMCPLTSLLYCSVICKRFCFFPSRNKQPLLNCSLLFTIPIFFCKCQNAFWNRWAFTA